MFAKRAKGREALDPAELPGLVDRLFRAAWAICGSPVDAEDLVQETFVRVLARPRALRNDDPMPYLMQTLRNTHLTGIRTSSRRPRTVELPAEESATMESTTGRPEVEFEHRQTLEAISDLKPDFREVLVAVDIVGLSYSEAAASLEIGEKTVATRLFRARDMVARSLSGEGGNNPGSSGVLKVKDEN